ncbi:MAG: RIP metalloprotease RseP, partial [Perlucidibaca sp.]
EYRLSAIPLGGFVRMLDEREGDVPEALLPYAFNRQSVTARMAIVAAGPLINLVFAVLLYWLLALHGGESLRPVVGRVLPATPAASAGVQPGDELVAVDGRDVQDWEGVSYALVDRLGESGPVVLSVRPRAGNAIVNRTLTIRNYLADSSNDPFRELGMVPWAPAMPPVIGQVQEGSAADRAGLQVGDVVLEINEHVIKEWAEVVEEIIASPERAMTWRIDRGGERFYMTVTPGIERDGLSDQWRGRLGIAVAQAKVDIPDEYKRSNGLGPVAALMAALDKTWHLISLSLGSLWKMVNGLIGVDNLSGPITIVKVAGQSASVGWEAFVAFMALLSVSLGVLNLLPIPVLDGGHLLYYAIEAIWRRPLPESVQLLGLRIGVALMGSVMLLAILNDIRRLF